MSNIKKIWGIRQRILESKQVIIDLLHLEKNSACSEHTHATKINRFILFKGDVRIKTDLGIHKLKIFEPFDVEPPLKHQFIVKKKSVMLEIAFVKNGELIDNDIIRFTQGGKFIKNIFYTHTQLNQRNENKTL